MNQINAPRGTRDVYPPESARWNRLEADCRDIAQRFGYGEIRTPIFEATELFARGVGETTDIVEKEMYTFLDKGDRSMTLRPELTAGVVRALLEHKLLAAGPQRLYYIGPFFRYERPQAGRYRQANQFGVECFGVAGAEADAEVIGIAALLIARYRLDAVLNINSVGDANCRPQYRAALLEHFRPHAAQLSADSQRRLERNPLRILDSKDPQDAPFVAGAPAMLDLLCDECRVHFDALRGYLDALGIAYVVNPRIVRGLDYYTRTVFEFVSSALGAQSTVCGGGRYDGLVQELGGPPTPGVGFGLGIERFLMVVEKLEAGREPERRGVQAIALGEAARARLLADRRRPARGLGRPDLRRLAGPQADRPLQDRRPQRRPLGPHPGRRRAGPGRDRPARPGRPRRPAAAARRLRGGGGAYPRRSHGLMEQDEAARVRALGEIAAEFDLDAIRVRTGDTEIEIVRRDPAAHAPAPVAYAPLPAAAPAGPAAGGEPGGPAAAPAAGANVRKVTAPVVGVFYRSASPGADPFVEIGQRVNAGDTLCILEAMKLMNEITTDHAGVVARALVENGELVSLGQELFWIEP